MRHWVATQLAAATRAAYLSMKKASQHNCGIGSRTAWRHRWALAPAALRARPSVPTGANFDVQTVSKGIACVLVFSVMPPHPRGHMSFCAFGWDVILYRLLSDALLEFHDSSDYARYVCTHGVGDEKHLVFECSALNGIRLRFPHLFTGFHTMSSFIYEPSCTTSLETSCISSLIVCEHSHDNLKLGVVPAPEPAIMLSHSCSLAKPSSSRCVAC